MLRMVADENYVMKIVKNFIVWPWIAIGCLLWLAGEKPTFYFMVTEDPFPNLYIQQVITAAMPIANFTTSLVCKIIIWRMDEQRETFGSNHIIPNKAYFILSLIYLTHFLTLWLIGYPTFPIPCDFTNLWGTLAMFTIVIVSHQDLKHFVTRKIKNVMFSIPMYSVNL